MLLDTLWMGYPAFTGHHASIQEEGERNRRTQSNRRENLIHRVTADLKGLTHYCLHIAALHPGSPALELLERLEFSQLPTSSISATVAKDVTNTSVINTSLMFQGGVSLEPEGGAGRGGGGEGYHTFLHVPLGNLWKLSASSFIITLRLITIHGSCQTPELPLCSPTLCHLHHLDKGCSIT